MKKQFRLYDIYRNVCTKDQSAIQGIKSYHCAKPNNKADEATEVLITFDNGEVSHGFYWGELKLKELVKKVNKHLGNCRKPGKKKKEAQDVR